MPSTIDCLPDEVLDIIVQHIPTRSLEQLSLVSQKWHRVVHSELFSVLSLVDRNAAQVEELYNDLFDEAHGVGCICLRGQHIRSMDYELREPAPDGKEVCNKLAALSRVFNALGSVAVLCLQLSLTEDASETFQTDFLAAMQSLFGIIRSKVRCIEIRVDIEASMSFPDETDDEFGCHTELTKKFSQICALIPPCLVTSLCLVGVELESLPPSLNCLMVSSTLRELSLQACNKTFSALPQVQNLEDLSISWVGQDEEVCGMRAAFGICNNNTTTLKSLSLQKVLPEQVHLPSGWSAMLALPVLTSLQLSDSHCGTGSLFDTIFSCTSLPKLSSLALEVEDILACAPHVNENLDKLENLSRLKFAESGNRREPEAEGPQTAAYHHLRDECRKKGIRFEASVSTRCTTPAELTYEVVRLEEMAPNLTHIELSCQLAVQPGIEDLPCVHFPSTQKLVLGFSGPPTPPLTAVGQAAERAVTSPFLKNLLEHFDCPNLVNLQISVSTNDEFGSRSFTELGEIVKQRVFPSLERITGALVAPRSMSVDNLDALKEPILSACEEENIDCAGLRFICRDGPIRGPQDDQDDDRSNVSDSSKEPSELSNQEKDEGSVSSKDNIRGSQPTESDSGASDFVEEPRMLIRRSSGASSEIASADSDHSSSPLSSSNCADSWLTDEDEILEAFSRPACQ